MRRRDRVRTFHPGDRVTSKAVSLGSAREYWTGIVIGYLAAVLTSVGLMLAFTRHGW